VLWLRSSPTTKREPSNPPTKSLENHIIDGAFTQPKPSPKWKVTNSFEPRRTAPKSQNKPKAKTTAPLGAARSEFIEQRVRYAHAIVAYHAGFEVDGTGDSEYAGAQALGGKQMEKARRAMLRIVALLSDEARPVTPLELNAMGGVLRLMAEDTENYGFGDHLHQKVRHAEWRRERNWDRTFSA
jgi:hypothetical protein